MTDKKPLNIHEQMLKFHKEFHGAEKTGTNPHFRSEHFTLDDIVNATTPVLQECGLYLIHQEIDGRLVSSIVNANGDSIKSSVLMPPTPNPQVHGSNLTYFKRYNSTGLFNIAEADDDGEAGANAAIHEDKKSEREPQPPVTDAQRELLQKHLDAFKMNPAAGREAKQLEKYLNSDSFTEAHAREILRKFKEI